VANALCVPRKPIFKNESFAYLVFTHRQKIFLINLILMEPIKEPILILFFCGLTILASAQSESKKSKVIADSKDAKAEFMKADKDMKGLFEKAYGYVIFLTLAKAVLGLAVPPVPGRHMNMESKLVWPNSLRLAWAFN